MTPEVQAHQRYLRHIARHGRGLPLSQPQLWIIVESKYLSVDILPTIAAKIVLYEDFEETGITFFLFEEKPSCHPGQILLRINANGRLELIEKYLEV